MPAATALPTMTTVESLRTRFPALSGPTTRLDGPAGSQIPRQVIESIAGYLATSPANLGGVFAESLAAEQLVREARSRCAAFFGTADCDEVGFGLNASGVNAAMAAAAAADMNAGDEVVVSVLDHDASVLPWRRAAAQHGLTLHVVGLAEDGRLDMDHLRDVINTRTRVVALPYAANATGTAVDVAEVTRLAHAVGALAWLDATHIAPHEPLRVRELDVDVAFCSAYKFFGPHLGLYYARRELTAAWARRALGSGIESGTPPLESLAGLIATFDYIDEAGWPLIAAHERALGEQFLERLPEAWQLLGLPMMDGRTPTFALTLPGAHPVGLARALAERGIAVGAGTFHAPTLFETLAL
ncbi:aminotransferase class V-fold PLP-dependent enzyme, partial [Actinospica sp.]|uniref:aminotransferase class V-fold PLP-dependent enzyme n=1 Tax=Actinospica sp. TaxID=1872142 RepID=UPI002CEB26D0